jgi:hypothetical protein
MANEKQLRILYEGVDAWNLWRKENPHISIDLSGEEFVNEDFTGANFCDANLSETDFRNAKLTKANLKRAILRDAHFNNANLAGADLSGAELYCSWLNDAKLCGAHLNNTDLTCADLGGAYLNGADLRGSDLYWTRLVDTNLMGAIISNCKIFGISAWKLKLNAKTIQRDLIITQPNEPVITTDDLEMAQFIYLLLHNENIRHVIDTMTSKIVLILGRFTLERKVVLDVIKNELRNSGYVPVIFDFKKPDNRDYTETVTTLARMAHFIIADITDPKCIPLELQSIIPDLAVPVQPLLLEGAEEFSMFSDLRRKYHWVLPVFIYKDLNNLINSLNEKLIDEAENKVDEIKRQIK